MSRIIRHDVSRLAGVASASVVSVSGADRGVVRGSRVARWRFVAAIIGAAAGAVVDGALEWSATADPESGLAGFVIERDGTRIATLPEQPRNPFGRPVLENLLYSDTPPHPLQSPRFVDPAPVAGAAHAYRVIAVNTVGLESAPSAPARR
ncbi:MAG: hypothetical protein FJ309_08190 [Planctomycetes bacterium]|nr:hypothetical protein [Planctomycetota bacterium]